MIYCQYATSGKQNQIDYERQMLNIQSLAIIESDLKLVEELVIC